MDGLGMSTWEVGLQVDVETEADQSAKGGTQIPKQFMGF